MSADIFIGNHHLNTVIKLRLHVRSTHAGTADGAVVDLLLDGAGRVREGLEGGRAAQLLPPLGQTLGRLTRLLVHRLRQLGCGEARGSGETHGAGETGGDIEGTQTMGDKGSQ